MIHVGQVFQTADKNDDHFFVVKNVYIKSLRKLFLKKSVKKSVFKEVNPRL